MEQSCFCHVASVHWHLQGFVHAQLSYGPDTAFQSCWEMEAVTVCLGFCGLCRLLCKLSSSCDCVFLVGCVTLQRRFIHLICFWYARGLSPPSSLTLVLILTLQESVNCLRKTVHQSPEKQGKNKTANIQNKTWVFVYPNLNEPKLIYGKKTKQNKTFINFFCSWLSKCANTL